MPASAGPPDEADLDTAALVRGSHLVKIARSVDERANVVIYLDPANPKLIGIANAGRISTVQLIDGEFPAVDRLYADSYPIQAVIRKEDLLGAAKRVSLVAERNAPIRMVFTDQQLTLTAGGAMSLGEGDAADRPRWRRHHGGIQPVLSARRTERDLRTVYSHEDDDRREAGGIQRAAG